jgi:hypothetical protein
VIEVVDCKYFPVIVKIVFCPPKVGVNEIITGFSQEVGVGVGDGIVPTVGVGVGVTELVAVGVEPMVAEIVGVSGGS